MFHADPQAISLLAFIGGELVRVLEGGNESTAKTYNLLRRARFVPNCQMQVL
jgi:hypothetical protein